MTASAACSTGLSTFSKPACPSSPLALDIAPVALEDGYPLAAARGRALGGRSMVAALGAEPLPFCRQAVQSSLRKGKRGSHLEAFTLGDPLPVFYVLQRRVA